MIRFHQIKLTLDEEVSALKQKCADKLKIPITDIIDVQIVKESLDARKKPFCFSYTVDVKVKNERKCRYKDAQRVQEYHYEMPKQGTHAEIGRVVVAGFGPGGMYAALLLAR